MIWGENAYKIVSSLEDNFAMPCTSSVKFYMSVPQRYKNLDSTACTASENKKLPLEVSEAHPPGLVH